MNNLSVYTQFVIVSRQVVQVSSGKDVPGAALGNNEAADEYESRG